MANILSSNFSRGGGCRERSTAWDFGFLGWQLGNSLYFWVGSRELQLIEDHYCMILIEKLSFRGLGCDYCTFAILYGAVNTKFTQLQHEVRGSVIHP